MRKILCALLLCSCAFASDTQRRGAAQYQTVETSIAWSSLINSYVLDSISPSSGVCLTFINNVNSSFSFNLSVYTSPDLNQITFTGNTGVWSQQPLSPTASTGASQFTIAALSVLQEYVRIPAAAHYVLNFSSPTASASNTVTIFATQTGSACGAINQWSIGTNGGNGVQLLNVIQAGVAGVRHVVNSISISALNNNATPVAGVATVFIRDGGTSANCSTGTVLWQSLIGVPATFGTVVQEAVTNVNVSSSSGNSIQCCYSAIMSTTINESCSVSGFDQ